MRHIIKNKRAIKSQIQALKNAILSSRVYLPKDVSKFIFLCGANKNANTISERRKAIINFSQTHLPHTQFFLAEKIFSVIQKEGLKDNILDIEHEISIFADHILIILESPSSFSELGAFSYKDLRKKLIVINDEKFSSSQSFINLGPLKAIEEATGKNNIINYKMHPDGIHTPDAIGDTFHPLYELLKDPIKGKASALNIDACNPARNFDKHSAMFVHDLIYFSGPVNYKELIEILLQLFGKKENFKLSQHVAILAAFESIVRDDAGLFRSNKKKPYYEYRFDVDNLISTFRNYTLKYFSERIYGH